MATFYYNTGLSQDIGTQWTEYLQHESYVRDFNQIISKNSTEIKEAINNGNANQIDSINNVCGQLEDMNFNLQSIDSNIIELRGEINNMASMIDWKMSTMIEEQRITNQLLGFIAQLLRIPESQKQRVYHIEQGLKYLKNAFMENDVNSLFYDDALEELEKAEKIERKDFITLNKIGQIHLYSKKHLNFAKAEEYFLKSARESFAEYNANGTTTSSNLNPSGLSYTEINPTKSKKTKSIFLCQNCHKNHSKWSGQCDKCKEWNTILESIVDAEEKNDSLQIDNFLISTVESYLLAARCCYLQRKLGKAIEYSKKSIELIPIFLSAKFDNAKYLASDNQPIKAVNILESIISIDRNFSVKTVKDRDLNSKRETSELIRKLKIDTSEKATIKLKELTSIIGKNSNATGIINNIKGHLSKNNYLSNMKSLDMLDASYKLQYITCVENKYQITKKYISPELKLKEFILQENQSYLKFEKLKKQITIEIDKIKKEHLMSKIGAGSLICAIGIFLTIGSIVNVNVGEMVLYVLMAAIFGALVGGLYGLISSPNNKLTIDDRT